MTKFDDLQYSDRDTPRYRRALRTTQMILNVMRDFIPRDRDCMRKMEEHLMRLAYESNSEIIDVPPEWDELYKLQLRSAMWENKAGPLLFTK